MCYQYFKFLYHVSVVAMGGDGTVNNVLNGLMSQSQKKCNVDVKPGFSPVKAQIPLGIIPTGKTNHIAFTVSGTDDFVTAALHIILGKLDLLIKIYI